MRSFNLLSILLIRSAGIALLIQTMLPLTLSAAETTAYKVAAGDVLSVSVYGDAGLTGLFTVSTDGTIGYPLLGNVIVVDKTVNQIGSEISRDLANYVVNRSVAVAVKEYAPIYIVGDVQKPGKYEFRPGMIVLELFALAGGLRETTVRTDTSGIQLVAAQQEYEDLSLQLLSQDVKRVRLEAELRDTAFNYSNNEPALLRDPGTIDKIVGAESTLYRLRLSAMQNEKSNLEAQRQNFVEEIETLEKGNALRTQQFQLLGMDVDASEELVTRGAASQSALRERKRELLAMNQQLLESSSFLARAEQNKNEVERRILELATKRHNDAATELRDIGFEMARIRKKMSFSLQTMAEIGASARRVKSLDQMIQTRFSVVRQSGTAYGETDVEEQSAIAAGDVIRVSLLAAGTPAPPRSLSGVN
ncbi:exopolysaccharide biosynthesis protein [Neorhizobium lilium]|uniref:Exopolysaccharide biosynthesis protein n=1 Tax=Neorhizobium lilium TaxID=2503024 RepID=A0A444LKR5_9HYPH|nr:polysaccharide biosynthesis/export family protein [Neorhizobium lilium]RWX80911.1 exopolysaccharide biosynthesis protein [Neorhizobium lilium]